MNPNQRIQPNPRKARVADARRSVMKKGDWTFAGARISFRHGCGRTVRDR